MHTTSFGLDPGEDHEFIYANGMYASVTFSVLLLYTSGRQESALRCLVQLICCGFGHNLSSEPSNDDCGDGGCGVAASLEEAHADP